MFNFEQDYGVFTDFVQNCNRAELSKCKEFVEQQIAAVDDKLVNEYVEGMKTFNSEQQQKIRELLNKKPTSDKKSKRVPRSTPCGYVEITYKDNKYFVPKYINVEEDDCFSAGNPDKKDWLNLKTKEGKKAAEEMYGAAKVISDKPGHLKNLAVKGLVRQQQNGQWIEVPASQL